MMRSRTASAIVGVATLILQGCATPPLEPHGLRGDATLPRAEVFFVREFEEGNDWLSANGMPAERPEILANLNSLTTKLNTHISKLGPTRVLMTSIPKQGLLVTGQIIRIRDGGPPFVEARILVFDLARSYHYPVTIFEVYPSQDANVRSLDDAWEFIARTAKDFLRQRVR